MVMTYKQRRPWLYDENGEKKPDAYCCDNCGVVKMAWKLPTGWVSGLPNGFCSDKCYGEHMDKVVEQARKERCQQNQRNKED